jgi:hypothetical protein
MTAYQTTIEHYGPNGLINTETVDFTLTGEDELQHLGPDKLKSAYSTIRQWSLDAQAAYDDWPNKTAAAKDATTRETIRRLGVFMDRLADLLLLEGRT